MDKLQTFTDISGIYSGQQSQLAVRKVRVVLLFSYMGFNESWRDKSYETHVSRIHQSWPLFWVEPNAAHREYFNFTGTQIYAYMDCVVATRNKLHLIMTAECLETLRLATSLTKPGKPNSAEQKS